MEVEFSQPPEIYYNYFQDEVTNPTIIKNSFSKTITIEGTKQNNNIFGHYWNLERIQDYGSYNGVYFNATKRTPFSLFVNGNLYETGYAKLLEVRKLHNGVEYDIELYGGLGQFFYGLTANEETGNKLKLSDLDYRGTSDSDTEFDFTINKDLIYDAWFQSTPNANESNLFHYINFVPSYNGYPKDVDSDKVLINTHNSPFFAKADEDGKPLPDSAYEYAYSDYGGSYVLGKLPQKMTEWEIGDLRAGLQRPAIRMKEIINACERYMARPENGGWTIVKDSRFFNSNNPYWEKTWLTLPMLGEMNYANETEEESSGVTPTPVVTKISNDEYEITGIDGRYGGLTMSARLSISSNSAFSQYPYLYLSQRVKYAGVFTLNYDSCICMRMRALDGVGNTITASPWSYLTNKRGNGYNWNIMGIGEENTIVQYPGKFIKSGSKYNWCNEDGSVADIYFNLNLQNRGFDKLVLEIAWMCDKDVSKNLVDNGIVYGDNNITNVLSDNDDKVYTTAKNLQTVEVAFISGGVSEAHPLSGAKFNKKALLDTSGTPADYFLSYCKLFGLHFRKDTDSNTIYVETRETYYESATTVDLEEMIDRSKDIKIYPNTFDKKWYDFKLENVDSEYVNDYKNTTSFDYGVKRINTGYDFDKDVKSLLTNNILKGAVECAEKSKYYSYFGNNTQIKPWMLDGISYNLYGVFDSGQTTEITMDAREYNVSGISSNKYYDLLPKVQFHQAENKGVDGANVLVMFRGYENLKTPDNKSINYWLTDDLDVMFPLNGNPCWIYTYDEYDNNGVKIARKLSRLPSFGRYWLNGKYITNSLDFGQPRQLYCDYITNESSTLYDKYWKSYIEDMYDVNTRILDCYVRLNERPNPNWLKRFYWFDNSLWRINKIEDWSVSSFETTKMQFIKVHNTGDYSSSTPSTANTLTISANPTYVAQSGEVVTFTVTSSDGSCWVGDDSWDIYFGYTPSGCGSTTFTVTVPPANQSRTMKLNIIGENNQIGNGCELYQNGPLLEVTEIGDYVGRNIPYQGGIPRYEIFSNSPWTVTSDNEYCLPHMESGGTGTSYLEVLWTLNDGFSSRSATLTFTNSQGNVVTQYKVQEGSYYTNLYYDYTGGTLTINAPSGGTVVSKPQWITIVDNGDGTYDFTADYNYGDYRNGTVIITYPNGKVWTVIVEQDTIGFSLSPESLIFDKDGGTQIINIKNPHNDNWIISSKPDWVTLSQSQGSGDATLFVETPSYDDERRTGAIVIHNLGNGRTYTIDVTQYGAAFRKRLTVIPSSTTVSGDEEVTVTFQITYLGRGFDNIYASFNGSMIKSVRISDFTGETCNVTVVTLVNPYYYSQNTSIMFYAYSDQSIDGEFLLNQNGSTPRLIVTPDNFRLDSSGTTGTFNIDTNDTFIIE